MLKTYYANDFAAKVRRPPWDFASNAPTMLSVKKPVSETADGAAATSSSSLLYGTALRAVHSYAPWAEDSASGFFTFRRDADVPKSAFTLSNMAHDFTRCSFDNVMFCGRESDTPGGARMRRNIVVCGVISIAGWAVVAWFVSTLPGVGGGISTFVFASMLALVPVTALQLAYGMAFTCFPMLPTCLVQDLVYSMQSLLPMSLVWPNELQTEIGCVDKYMAMPNMTSKQVCVLGFILIAVSSA